MSSENKKGFFSGIKKEYSKITWPKRGDLFRTTLIVLVTIIGVSIVVYGLDTLLHFLLSFTV